ncbi:MAG: hypothetical protein ACU84Q_16125 [Gammaproteobacteria bacterium]
MRNQNKFSFIKRIGAAAVGLLASTGALADGHFEAPAVFSASKILPATIVAGPNHRVQDHVNNDGFLNIYNIDSKYGPIRAVSTATLFKRIGELNAMAGMEELQGTDEFKKNFSEKAGDFVEGGAMLLRNPVGSVTSAASGVASLFRSVGNTLQYGMSETESSRVSALSGFAKTKREYAAKFNVDVYSRNHYLQDALDKTSRAGFLGTTLVRLGTAAVSGGAGAALSVTGNVQALNEILHTKSPGDLRGINEKALKGMGVSADVSEIFLENRAYTVSQQTALIHALGSMSSTTNRAAFIKFATLTTDPDMAAFRRRQAEMYARYHRNVAPVTNFEYLDQVACARTKDGTIVFSAPLDHMRWTQDLGPFVEWINNRVNALPNVSKKVAEIGGNVSELTRKNMTALGWSITENSLNAIAGR